MESTQSVYSMHSPVGARNGLEEQMELLSRLSTQLDEYFAMRSLGD